MSELAELTTGAPGDVLPGYRLSPFGLAEFAEAEAEFARRHVEILSAGTSSQPQTTAEKALLVVSGDIASGTFSWGMPSFGLAAHAIRNLPFLLWLSLREKHPTLTPQACAKLVDAKNIGKVRQAVLEMMDFKFTKKKSSEKRPLPSAGERSSNTSEPSAVSDTLKSPS